MKFFPFVSLLLISSGLFARELPSAKPEAVGMSSDRLTRITEVVQRHIDSGALQGAVIGVARRGKVVYLKAQGQLHEAKNIPMPTDALFYMASSTKPILGVAAMMMVEQGLFKPSDPVEKYIPEFKGIQVAVLKEPADEDISPDYVSREDIPEHRLVDAHRPITIQDLLTHTSGLASYGLGMAVSEVEWDDETLATWIAKVGAGPLDFQPGARWAYSGSVGLDVVARIIEIVSGVPFNEFVHERILKPLDMKDTHWNVPESKHDRQVVIRGWKYDQPYGPTKYFSGSTGMISTARDYLHFEQMLLNGGTLFGNRLLGPRSVQLMSSNQVGELYKEKGETLGVGFGYTVAITLDPIAAHSFRSAGSFGWAGALGTTSWTEPKEDLVAVIMVQQKSVDLHDDIANAIRQAIIE